jgi:S1-C subfamily serine protease
MMRRIRSFTFVLVALLILTLNTSAQDSLARMLKQHEPLTITVALEFAKKNRNIMIRALAAAGAAEPNGHATGFLVGEGLVMTSYHVVSGRLSPRKKRLLGFKADDELEVKVYVNECQAKVVKVDPEADLALLKICSTKQVQRPTFKAAPSPNEQVLLIAQPGPEKMVRRGSFNGSYAFGGLQYLSAKIDGQDGFSGSPIYDRSGEIIGVFSLYDYKQGVALLSPGVKAQEFLAAYEATVVQTAVQADVQ